MSLVVSGFDPYKQHMDPCKEACLASQQAGHLSSSSPLSLHTYLSSGISPSCHCNSFLEGVQTSALWFRKLCDNSFIKSLAQQTKSAKILVCMPVFLVFVFLFFLTSMDGQKHTTNPLQSLLFFVACFCRCLIFVLAFVCFKLLVL